MAFERLELSIHDVLLDIGTGTGDKAIAAAHSCRRVIGIDIDKKSLEQALAKAARANLDNIIFAYGTFEEPCAEIALTGYAITKILMLYSLHHLSDTLKKKSLCTLVNLLHPNRVIIGDLMFFDDPNKHRDKFEDVHYDGGDTDFPSKVEYLKECFEQLGAKVRVEEHHPLAGIIIGYFPMA